MNPEITFDEKKHEYKLNGSVIPSATQIINSILPPYNVPTWYMQRGSAVHACAAFIAQRVKFKNDPRINGQVKAIRKFFKEVKPKVLEVEQLLYSDLHRFAGTLDLISAINTSKFIVDYKGSFDLERGALQLAAYSIMTKPMINYGIIVEIKDDGNYKMSAPIKLRPYRNKFLALRTVYEIRSKMGYNKKTTKTEV